jgi:hypothetical protein
MKEDVNFEGATPVISSAQKFIIRVPKGRGVPLVYPKGDKKGEPITDWQGEPIGEEGVVFFNEKDNAYQAVKSDGEGVTILNEVNEFQAQQIKSVLGKGRPFNALALVTKLMIIQSELGIKDMYNSDVNFIEAKMTPVGDSGLYKRDDRDICHAVKLEGSGEFQGPAATAQKYEDGAILIKQGDDIRLVQSDVFQRTYKSPDGSEVDLEGMKVVELDSRSSDLSL